MNKTVTETVMLGLIDNSSNALDSIASQLKRKTSSPLFFRCLCENERLEDNEHELYHFSINPFDQSALMNLPGITFDEEYF